MQTGAFKSLQEGTQDGLEAMKLPVALFQAPRSETVRALDFSLSARACHEGGAAWFLNSTTDLFFLSNKALCVSRVELASSMPVMHGDCQYPEMVLRLQANSERKTQKINVETLGTGAKPKNLATTACLVNHILVCRVAPAAPPCRASAFCSSLVSRRPGSYGICREGVEFVVETSSVYCMDMFGVLVSGKPVSHRLPTKPCLKILVVFGNTMQGCWGSRIHDVGRASIKDKLPETICNLHAAICFDNRDHGHQLSHSFIHGTGIHAHFNSTAL